MNYTQQLTSDRDVSALAAATLIVGFLSLVSVVLVRNKLSFALNRLLR